MLVTFLRWAKGSREVASEGPIVLHISKKQLGVPAQTWRQYWILLNTVLTTVLNTWLDDSFVEIQSKLRRNVIEWIKAPIFNLEKRVNPSILKDEFFLKNRSIHFHINSTSVIRSVKWNQLSFSSIEATSCASPQCLVDQIHVQKPILVAATDQMPDHTYSRE